eukprot:c19435_g1_i1 orf=620-2593(-)
MGFKIYELSPQLNTFTCFGIMDMRRWLAGVVAVCVFVLLLLRLKVLDAPLVWPSLEVSTNQSSVTFHAAHYEEINRPTTRPKKVERIEEFPLLSGLSKYADLANVKSSTSEFMAMSLWRHLEPWHNSSDKFPEASQGLKEAKIAWKELLEELRLEVSTKGNKSMEKTVEKQCPYSVSSINNGSHHSLLQIPCGLIVDSSLTLIAVPEGAAGDFVIELLGPNCSKKSDVPIILHYNVRLQGDQITDTAVIVQNTWTRDHGWAEEERCPLPGGDDNRKVDGLDACTVHVGKDSGRKTLDKKASRTATSWWGSNLLNGNKKLWFPFVNGFPFAATLWVGWEGFHMTVNGKHVTSFEYRQNLEPSLVANVRLNGGLRLVSLMANGLPYSEDITKVVDLELLRAPSLSSKKKRWLFVGVFSTGNNFDRRMAVRRSWMQFEAVRKGIVTVRFFVGLHSTKHVNKELWEEAMTYGDIQLMPFVDYYNLITLKTIAICIFGTKVLPSKYIMKTDDDTFVRVDEVLSILNKTKHTAGLLYGSMEFDSRPHRDPNSKWFIRNEEWSHSFYPPYALGPGYIVSRDIAQFVVQAQEMKQLKLFKLEDVSMGMWVDAYKRQGNAVHYINDDRFINTGCQEGYVIAHYQSPRLMVCLWQKLVKDSVPLCCG